LAKEFSDFRPLTMFFFLHVYTYNMAAWCDNGVNYVTAPRVLEKSE